MYNLIEYSKNYRKTTWNLLNDYRDEPNSGLGGANNNIIPLNIITSNNNIIPLKIQNLLLIKQLL